MVQAYIGLGSNLNDPGQQLRRAVQALASLPQSHIVANSGVFKSAPMTAPGDEEVQPDYLNAVVKLQTTLTPQQLLQELQAIELAQGRVRNRTWGPRTLDLDILMYDDLQLRDEQLSIPHPGIAERDFVLYPLRAIDEQLVIPGLGPLSTLIAQLGDTDIEFVGPLHE